MNTRGVTMLELAFAVAIFSVVMGVLFTFSIGFGDTAQVQGIKTSGNDEVRRALQAIVPDLHQAISGTINWAELPGDRLSYQVPEDLDGNGIPVNIGGRLEHGTLRTIMRDADDLNADGFGVTQLVGVSGDNPPTVLANGISEDAERPDENGEFTEAQDTNGNGRMDNGVWFEPWGRGIAITLQTQGTTRRGVALRTTYQEIVYPRN